MAGPKKVNLLLSSQLTSFLLRKRYPKHSQKVVKRKIRKRTMRQSYFSITRAINIKRTFFTLGQVPSLKVVRKPTVQGFQSVQVCKCAETWLCNSVQVDQPCKAQPGHVHCIAYAIVCYRAHTGCVSCIAGTAESTLYNVYTQPHMGRGRWKEGSHLESCKVWHSATTKLEPWYHATLKRPTHLWIGEAVQT